MLLTKFCVAFSIYVVENQSIRWYLSFYRSSSNLPPKLRNQGPPQLVDPAHVVPLSQYQRFRDCQPNISLLPPPTAPSKDDQPQQENGFVSSLVYVDEQTTEKSYTQQRLYDGKNTPSSNDLITTVHHPRILVNSANKNSSGYSVSICPSNYNNKSSPSFSASKGTQDRKSYTVTDTKGSTNAKTKGCSFKTPDDLQIITVDPSSVPKDLQIIKLNSNVSNLRNVQVLDRGLVGSSISKELKIIKLSSPIGSSRRPASTSDVSVYHLIITDF